MAGQCKRWIEIYHWNFGYTKCPYCGDETEWYNPMRRAYQSDHDNNRRKHCPKCGNRIYAREGLLINQPPKEEQDADGA